MSESTTQQIITALQHADEDSIREALRQLEPEVVAGWLLQLPHDERVQILDLLSHADAADTLEQLTPETAAEALSSLEDQKAADILELMEEQPALRLLGELETERAADLLEEMASDEAADLLGEMEPQQSETLLAEMEPEERQGISQLLEYPPDSAGGRMITEVLALSLRFTVQQAMQFVREQGQEAENLYYLYVVDDERRLVGVVSLRDLLLSPPSTPLEAILNTDVETVNALEDQEEIAQRFRRHRYLALPVVDDERHLLGVVTLDDMIEVVDEEASEDALQMVGVAGVERSYSSVRESVRNRLPWLFVNLGTAFLAAWVVSRFQTTIARATLLAVLMPVIAGQGGNAGTQGLTIIIRGMALGEVRPRQAPQILWRELRVGIIMGCAIGLAVGLGALIWQGNPYLGVVVCVAMVLNLITAALAAVIIPVGLRWLGIDPALASSIFLTTVTDCAGFFFFLGLGTVFLERLA